MNQSFLVNNQNGRKINNQSFIFKKGQIPILLCASHAVKQYRENKIKPSDYLTGPLTMYLAERCNCSYFVRVFNDYDDPNYPLGITLAEIENDYLKDLQKVIQENQPFLVIDLHGCSNQKKYDCSLWHHNFKMCELEIIEIFKDNLEKINLSVDNGSEFLGGQVVRQSGLITNSFQIEIKRKIRTLKSDNYLLESFLDSMEKSIDEVCIRFFK